MQKFVFRAEYFCQMRKQNGTLAAAETVMHTCRYAVLWRSCVKAAHSHRQRGQSSRLQTEAAARVNEQIAVKQLRRAGPDAVGTLHTPTAHKTIHPILTVWLENPVTVQQTGISFNRQSIVRWDGCGCGTAWWRLSTVAAGGSKTRRVTQVDPLREQEKVENTSPFSPLELQVACNGPSLPPKSLHSTPAPVLATQEGRQRTRSVHTNNRSDRQGPRREREKTKKRMGEGGFESSEERCLDLVFFLLSISHFRGRQVKGHTPWTPTTPSTKASPHTGWSVWGRQFPTIYTLNFHPYASTAMHSATVN